MTWQTYRKRPIEIQAVQLTEDNILDVADDVDGQIIYRISPYTYERVPHKVLIATLEGGMVAEPGDYVIEGIQGEFYPCKEDIFLDSYTNIKYPL